MLLDTCAWVEYLNASQKGKLVLEMLENEGAETSVASIAELADWALKNNRGPDEVIEQVRKSSTILPLTEEISAAAGKLHFSIKKETPKWGMVDSIIYATALHNNLKVITGDSHFRGKPNAVMI
ncbi:MAG: PIN domain-containing protein [archaeon]